ncbi:hypothetical protein GCM10009117_08120 [Gangjinia marincola]|uniref:Secretion system C-terminal sorting domain-containing protein n=1 Tax=Gangjinia marincola TaxID=578463 RepID=A0ABN1MEW5_9FLAO
MNKIWIGVVLFYNLLSAQSYTSYFTGDTVDASPQPTFGVCLMGGATENDEAMAWFLERANGGDVVVLRANGGDGYNDYFFNDLGVTINSVETLVINALDGATDPYVLQQISNAEAIWFAGGNQYNYITYFKDSIVEDILNEHINVKGGVIGGTSAGMAIMGSHLFDAQNGTATSAEVLADPYDDKVSLNTDFLEVPFLENTITDTHYDRPDADDSPERKGRHTGFIARFTKEDNQRFFGIAAEEYTAVCINEDGRAYVYGNFPEFDDYAYFIQPTCSTDFGPEICEPNTSLTWDLNTEALQVYKVPGTTDGNNYFDLFDKETAQGGSWEKWYVIDGVLNIEDTTNPGCNTLSVNSAEANSYSVSPNPFIDQLRINTKESLDYTLRDVLGNSIMTGRLVQSQELATDNLSSGVYFLTLQQAGTTKTIKLLKQ